MWNYLRSDLYRVLHMRMFYYVIIASIITGCTLQYIGFDFYYLIKAPYFTTFALLFICLVHSEEYDSLYFKNIYPFIKDKYKLIIERYVLNVIICLSIIAVMSVSAIITSTLSAPSALSIPWIDFILFVLVETLLLCCVASFLVMLVTITRSKSLLIIVATSYSFLLIYALEVMLATFFLNDSTLVRYTIYGQFSGLPTTFQPSAYTLAFVIIVTSTLMYNSISALTMTHKDM